MVHAQPRSEAVRALSPAGKIPAMTVDGVTLTDSVAIVQFLAASGRLVEVLADFAGVLRPIVALFPANRRLSAKLRAFLDFYG